MSDKNNVIKLPVETRLDITPNRVLESAIDQLESVFIIGYDLDGNEYIATNKADGGEALWLLERAKYRLVSGT